jgi:hypothetical protein
VETHAYQGRRALSAALLSAAVAVGVTACGLSNSTPSGPSSPLAALSADQIAAKAINDLKAASSVRVTGDVASGGQTFDLDLTLVRAQGCGGTLAERGTGSFQLISIGTLIWIKPDAQFWNNAGGGDAAVLKIVSGKYLKVKDTSAFGSFRDFCDVSQFAGSFGNNPTGLVKGKTAIISGQSALQIKDTGDAAYIYVSETAKPQILQIADASEGKLVFSAYNSPATLTAPRHRDTLSGAKYGL